MTAAVVEKYLDRYAEPEAADLTLPGCYDHNLVIPAHQETSASLKAVWQKIPKQISLLVTIVVNSSKPSTESEIKLFDELMNAGPVTTLKPGICLLSLPMGPDLLLIDRFSENRTIDSRHGVGLARKIGCDVALQLYRAGHISSPWLRSTDADAVLPADYFGTDVASAAGFLYPFRHSSGYVEDSPFQQRLPHDRLAAALYDLSLLYYPAGLLQAGSPYGFPTVGSTLCCAAEAYAHVRGFPKRNTGEDFYLLNKLCKVGPVRAVGCSPIELSSRRSTRVPIGTGQAMARIAELDNPVSDFHFEHPDCFRKLHEFLQRLQQIANSGSTDLLSRDQTASLYAETSGLQPLVEKNLKEQTRPEVRLKFMTDWFDALRTRQFIHQVRDQECGTLPLEELARHFAVDEAAEAAITSLRHRFADQIYH